MNNNKQQYFKLSKKVGLPVNDSTAPDHVNLVPRSHTFENHKHLLEQIGIAIRRNLPVLLIGETGSGKTSLIRYLAHKTNNAFRRVNHNGGTMVDDIKGKILINKEGTYWIDGVLVEAMKKGYWYLADEINASTADINFVYHSLLDDDGYVVLEENGGEIVRPHENFRFFATMNPATDYAGTKELNRALLSRFVVVKTDFSPPAVEAKILIERSGVKHDVAEKMVKFAGEIRSTYAKQKINFVLSTRDLIMWADMYKEYGKYITSAEIALLNKVNTTDFESVKDLLGIHFKALDNPKEDVKQAKKTTQDF